MRLKLLWILGVIIILAALQSGMDAPSQTVVPECFAKDDCKMPIKEGFCDIDYNCIQGRCYSTDILCPETCYGGMDDDQDGLVDCADPDCWNDPYCPCERAPFTMCEPGKCYCASGFAPAWYVEGTSHYCECVTG